MNVHTDAFHALKAKSFVEFPVNHWSVFHLPVDVSLEAEPFFQLRPLWPVPLDSKHDAIPGLLQLKNRLDSFVQDPYALDLLDKLLVLDPAQRCDSDTALSHNFFFTKPDICDLKPMLSRIPNSQFDFLTTRHQAQAAAAAPPPARTNGQNQHVEHIF